MENSINNNDRSIAARTENSRRGFMASVARLTIAGIIGSGTGYLALQTFASGKCTLASACTSCIKLRNGCRKPQAEKYRAAKKDNREAR